MHIAFRQRFVSGEQYLLAVAREVERDRAEAWGVKLAGSDTQQAASEPTGQVLAERMPLTRVELTAKLNEYGPQDDGEGNGFCDGFRAAERHHGITGSSKT
jgi:hypothetical protein